jgi:hypothetical protein
MRPHTLLLLASLLPAAARSGEPSAPSAPPPLAHRSSIAAVLSQAGALRLTPDQIKLLEHADSVLMRDQAAVRAAAASGDDDAKGAEAGARPSGGKPGPTVTPTGPGGGMSGGKSKPPPPRRGGPDPTEVLNQQLDVLDTEAFLKAIEPLPEAQREKAIEIASRYREQVYEQREREKQN